MSDHRISEALHEIKGLPYFGTPSLIRKVIKKLVEREELEWVKTAKVYEDECTGCDGLDEIMTWWKRCPNCGAKLER